MKAGLLSLAALAGLSACAPGSATRPATNHPTDMSHLVAPDSFRAIGTEPFWGLAVDGATARYSTPEIPESIATHVVRRRDGNIESLSGKLGDLPFVLIVRPGSCSDGMSDRTYPFVASLRIGETALSGCAAG